MHEIKSSVVISVTVTVTYANNKLCLTDTVLRTTLMSEGTSLMHFGLRVQVTHGDLPDPHIQQPTQEEGTLWYYLYG